MSTKKITYSKEQIEQIGQMLFDKYLDSVGLEDDELNEDEVDEAVESVNEGFNQLNIGSRAKGVTKLVIVH